jgi:F-type H+-transporting ATPase subunit gamma
MANLKEIRVRIASVTTTRQITSAMKMVSAAKLKKAQDAIIQLRPYAVKLSEIIENISADTDSSDNNIYGMERPLRNVLIVLVTSNRGMCGAFNSNAIKQALLTAHVNYDSLLRQGHLKFITIGKKGNDYLKGKKYPILNSYGDIIEKPNIEKALPVADQIIELFETGQFDKIILVYNRFKNAGVQILTEEQLLPIPKKESKTGSKSNTNYIYEPDKETILTELIPKSLRITFFKALLDSFASEHGARMTAMHKATDNATELIKELTLNYNKARQAAITNEILEIVGGAEALRG